MNLSLEQISTLQDNWNGDGASKFSDNLITLVDNILKELPKPPDVYPTARDSIQIEYEKPDGDYLEFEIFIDKICKMSLSPKGESDTAILTYPTDLNKIKKYINNFYKE